MDIFTYNLSWMSINIILALIPLALAAILKKKLNGVLKFAVFVIWLLYLPNTIYLVTDLQYLPEQFFTSSYVDQLILIVMYSVLTVLGIVTYLLSIKAFEMALFNLKIKIKDRAAFYLILNFVISFGMVMGKIQRTESWDVFIDPVRVVRDALVVITTPNLIALVVIFGIFTNFVYFAARRKFKSLREK